MHCQWRSCKDWKNAGIPMSTTSNEASKMFDATVTQFFGFYEDNSLGGIGGCMEKMFQADPDFIMGHVLKNGLEILGTGRPMDPELQKQISHLVKLSKSPDATQFEKDHVEAVKLLFNGAAIPACEIWEDILVEHPQDALALKFALTNYFYRGYATQLRDTCARVLPHWKSTNNLYGYLLGVLSFGMEETNIYDRAEKMAKQALEINRSDVFSTHTLCHVFEMQGRQDEGISYLGDTVKNWDNGGSMSGHNFWHWALYHVEKGDYNGALGVYDSEVNTVANKHGAMLNITDCCSLLYRLEMEGVNVGDRWNDMFELCRPHIDDHVMVFNDVHLLMACLQAKKTDIASKMMESIRDYVRKGQGANHSVTQEVGQQLCEAFVAYSDGDYAKAVDLLHPIRYNIIKIGGSHAQRDVFSLFLIQAALKSPLIKHHKLARSLLIERKSWKENAPMTDRLLAKAMALHAD